MFAYDTAEAGLKPRIQSTLLMEQELERFWLSVRKNHELSSHEGFYWSLIGILLRFGSCEGPFVSRQCVAG